MTPSTCEPEVERFGVMSGRRLLHQLSDTHAAPKGIIRSSGAAEGVAIDSLEPGTTLVVTTQNSYYHLVILLDPSFVLMKGGTMFPEATVVRLDGSTAGGSALKMGWILVGFQIEMWLGSVRIRSSRVRSVSIESVPAVRGWDGPVRA
jgi:hypothetical protein